MRVSHQYRVFQVRKQEKGRKGGILCVNNDHVIVRRSRLPRPKTLLWACTDVLMHPESVSSARKFSISLRKTRNRAHSLLLRAGTRNTHLPRSDIHTKISTKEAARRQSKNAGG